MAALILMVIPSPSKLSSSSFLTNNLRHSSPSGYRLKEWKGTQKQRKHKSSQLSPVFMFHLKGCPHTNERQSLYHHHCRDSHKELRRKGKPVEDRDDTGTHSYMNNVLLQTWHSVSLYLFPLLKNEDNSNRKKRLIFVTN